MVVDRELADKFIEVYKTFLLLVSDEFGEVSENEDLLTRLQIGRGIYLEDKGFLDDFAAEFSVSAEIIEAIASLDYGQWVYLRDTSKYSLFIKEDHTAAFSVLGLVQPLKELCGRSGMYFGAGLLQLGGKYVCDGLLVDTLYLGKNLRDEYNEAYKELKKEGKFYKNP